VIEELREVIADYDEEGREMGDPLCTTATL
jgi:hypothetical protein